MIKKILGLSIIGIFICFGAAQAVTLGESVVFNVDPMYDSSGRESLTATLKVVSDYAYFYVDNDYWNSLNGSKRSLFLNTLINLANEFDTVIYPKERAVFGSERSPGIDGDKKITILISQLVDDAGGYLNTFDGYGKELAPTSNEREMLYLNAVVMMDSKAKAFLAHEFQHLISFYQKTILYGLEEDVWLNEARSEYAVTLCGYNDNYTNSYLSDRVDSFLDYPEDSLTEWKNNMSDYGVASLFFHYLVDHYGTKIITSMILNDKTGIASIDQSLKDLNYSETFSDIFANWVITNYVNDCKLGDDYCYKNKNLTYERLHTEYSASYSGFPDLIVSRSSAVGNWSPRWYRFRQGTVVPTDNDILKLEFDGSGQNADFNVPYIVMDQSQTTVQFMSLDKNQKGTIYIPNFTSLNKLIVIAPFNQYKKSNFSQDEPLTPFTFTASSIKGMPISINSVVPNSGAANGGSDIIVKGNNLLSAKKIVFGEKAITDFSIIDDQTIGFTIPPHQAGKIDIRVIDNEDNESVLANSFNYLDSYPEGSLIRAKGDTKVYIIKGGYKRWIQHQDIFNMYGHLSWNDIIDVEPEVLNQYQDAWLIRAANDQRVYEVNADGTKHWLNMTAEEFTISGHRWDMVYVVNNFERNFYRTGSHILFQ